jgi:predicted transcriptional regulator
MFLQVRSATTVTLEDANSFRSFKVVVAQPNLDLDTVRRALSGIATLPDRDTAWVSEQALRSWAEVASDTAWQAALTAMIAKARPHGWIDDTNKTIKAHVEWAT